MTARESYDELCAYSLLLGDPGFIHQHVVDAFAAQTADEQTKPITLTFALVGLYLLCERGFTGREVQATHMRMARRKVVWPSLALPEERGAIGAADVLAKAAGRERNEAIYQWCRAVWKVFRANESAIKRLLAHYPIPGIQRN